MSCSIGVRITLCVASLLLAASPSGAVPITWTLIDAVFEDGSAATGSFVYDADLRVYSNVSIITDRASYDTGDLRPAILPPERELNLIDGFVPNDNDGKSILFLFFLPELTDAGGTLLLDVTPTGVASSEFTCFSADCNSFGSPPGRKLVSGSVTTVPEPTSLMLLGLGLAAIKVAQQRQSNERATPCAGVLGEKGSERRIPASFAIAVAGGGCTTFAHAIRGQSGSPGLRSRTVLSETWVTISHRWIVNRCKSAGLIVKEDRCQARSVPLTSCSAVSPMSFAILRSKVGEMSRPV